jgi:hypothetical protein
MMRDVSSRAFEMSLSGGSVRRVRREVRLVVVDECACIISFVDLLMFPFGVLIGGCAAIIRATSFYRSSWYFGFFPSRRFAGGQC